MSHEQMSHGPRPSGIPGRPAALALHATLTLSRVRGVDARRGAVYKMRNSTRLVVTIPAMSNVTQLLRRFRAGEPGALDELMPLVYGELRRTARAFMRRQPQGHTLQPTALVNEAFIKLFGEAQPEIADRAHFLALMSRVMRQVLVDHARSAAADKRGGGAARVSWDTNVEIRSEGGAEELRLLDLHRALDALARENAVVAEAVEMHYFGGLTAEEVALAAGRSPHVVRHELRFARAWLRRALAG